MAVSLVSLGPLVAGCGLRRPPARVPMELLTPLQPLCPAGSAHTLVVLLPGAYSRPREFVDEGFVEALRARGAAVEVVVADAHLGYFEDRSVIRRLRDDVVLPARRRGIGAVWLVGISLGGFAALGYGARHGAEVSGVVALAPYLGRRTLLRDIVAAGGPRGWHAATPLQPGDDDLEAEVWHWLARGGDSAGNGGQFAGGLVGGSAAGGSPPPPVYLGFGRDDRFAAAHALLAGSLPAERVFSVPGGHDWPPWRALWLDWLARSLLPTRCGA